MRYSSKLPKDELSVLISQKLGLLGKLLTHPEDIASNIFNVLRDNEATPFDPSEEPEDPIAWAYGHLQKIASTAPYDIQIQACRAIVELRLLEFRREE